MLRILSHALTFGLPWMCVCVCVCKWDSLVTVTVTVTQRLVLFSRLSLSLPHSHSCSLSPSLSGSCSLSSFVSVRSKFNVCLAIRAAPLRDREHQQWAHQVGNNTMANALRKVDRATHSRQQQSAPARLNVLNIFQSKSRI